MFISKLFDSYLIVCVCVCRESGVDYAKWLAEMVDTKLARHYELDDGDKKKVWILLLTHSFSTTVSE